MSDSTKTTDDQMYQMLFRAIHEHYLKPDTHLPEDELAKSFNVSRTRVRKILQRLIYEQLVVQLPNRGCFVASMGKPQVNEIFTTRKILELGVIDLLNLPLNDAQVTSLTKLCDAEMTALRKAEYGLANKLSGDFHIQIAKFTENVTLITLIEQLIARTSLAIAMYSNPTTMQCDNHCHFDLIKLLQQTDKALLKNDMAEHLSELAEQLLIEPQPKQPPNFNELFNKLGDK
ncbi:GntR family transcriptional regulator (plasmid) [Moraxella osloensis]|uniref:GntR family transcriptional regulator n=1 Tax=Faucicola osloensis TaxID=34062 RepID=A0AAD0AJA3_FAUOS|nr:GntR family transcriptional regulator [Moraxella osloensis]ATQ84333.1 GntR family transcriptional regulator [Moraxella osloensis]ATW86791.1 GntR family transcriptional regulator [Moraxella osloensis]BAV12824.1 GntR family transcriptional regulator [Moraxella osloensis]